MSPIGGLAIYGLIWWLTFFAVLPFGVRTSSEAGEELVEGAADSAPVRPQLRMKVLVTSCIALLIWSVVFAVMEYEVIALDDIPFFPSFSDEAYSPS